jgi:hypothetical protein
VEQRPGAEHHGDPLSVGIGQVHDAVAALPPGPQRPRREHQDERGRERQIEAVLDGVDQRDALLIGEI